MKRIFLYILSLFVVLISFQACDDDSISSNPNHMLSFSNDTLRLDTIFTNIRTSTYLLKVYNKNKQSVVVSSLVLADAANSGFRMNVDGVRGNSFSDIEIKSKDSLYIFVEATPEATEANHPFLMKDSIVFITNTVRQDVKLVAYAQNVYPFRGKVIERDTTLTAARPLLIYDSLCVAENVTLTLQSGTQLYFHDKAILKVRGRIKAEGTIEAPVVLRGDRTDRLYSNLPYDRLPGQWEGVVFYPTSMNNHIEYMELRGSVNAIRCEASDMEQTKLTILNSRITQSSRQGLDMRMCKAIVANTEISNAGGDAVSLLGGNYEFIHCTLANYFSWNTRKGVALAISNTQANENYPLSMASFRNCVIAGSMSDELMGNRSSDDSVPFNYYFSHCLINSPEDSGSTITEVVWKRDDHFMELDRAIQYYDFRLGEGSAAINIGSLIDAADYPTDRNGESRISDEAPDAGCYEWQGM